MIELNNGCLISKEDFKAAFEKFSKSHGTKNSIPLTYEGRIIGRTYAPNGDIKRMIMEITSDKDKKTIEGVLNKPIYITSKKNKMKRNLDYSKVEEQIVFWLKDYAVNAKMEGFVIGVSGGIDSSCTSTLCAKTGLKVICASMPIHQHIDHVNRAKLHIDWLMENFPNVTAIECDLTNVFDTFIKYVETIHSDADSFCIAVASANSRARLRMTTLYHYAPLFKVLVVGTGNFIEDQAVGYCSKFGDNACDLSPIGSLMKSEVKKLARHMGVKEELVNAIPSDGLYDQELTDEQSLECSYDELEYIVDWIENGQNTILSSRLQEVLVIYNKMHSANEHKNKMPPICNIDHLRK